MSVWIISRLPWLSPTFAVRETMPTWVDIGGLEDVSKELQEFALVPGVDPGFEIGGNACI